MTLVQAWIDSLTLLKPKNLQLFAMVTLKSIVEAYKLMFKYFWWVILLIELCYVVLLFSLYPMTIMWSYLLVIRLAFWLYQLLLFAVCTITRPSIVKKDCAYFRSQFFSFFYFAILLLFLPREISSTPFSAWTVFLLLFFLDSEKGPKHFLFSMWNALKMIVFNFPLMLCVYAAMWLLNIVVSGFIFAIVELVGTNPFILQCLGLLQSLLIVLLLPIGVCIYANIYIKKLHDQFDLYFKPVQ
jgi:hypothetical protein